MNRFRYLLLLPVFALTLLASTSVNAQDDATKILNKMRRVDLLNQILPVLMTPEQLQKLLPPIEAARKAKNDIERSELTEMKKLEAELDAAIKEAKEKSQVPSSQLQTKIFTLLKILENNRKAMVNEQNEAVLKAVEENLDEGQIKAATNSLTLPDGQKLSDRAKLSHWVRAVLMDPLSYDLLVELSRKK